MDSLSVGAFFFLYQVLHIKNLQVYICSLILVKHLLNDCIGWFSSIHLFFDFVKTHIKWLHRLVFSFKTYFERSCRSMKQVWKLLLDVSGVILCNVHAGEFGVWSLHQCYVCKNKYIYIILHVPIKKCKYVAI